MIEFFQHELKEKRKKKKKEKEKNVCMELFLCKQIHE